MLRVLSCLGTQHDLGLVGLSACICLLGCFSTVALMARAEAVDLREAWRWLTLAAVLFGGSVWALHFVAMLAYLPGDKVAYAVDLTLLSVAAAIVGCLVALLFWRHARPNGTGGFLLAGTTLGTAIAAMHYLGALAMGASGIIAFDVPGVAASILISIAGAGAGVIRAQGLDGLARRLEVTIWLTLAICGMHFTGMSATTIAPLQSAGGIAVIGSTQLALAVGLVSIVILIAGLIAILMQQYLSRRRLDELARMRLLGDLAYEVLLIHDEGRILEINSAGCRLLGLPGQQIVELSVFDLFAAHELPRLNRRARCSAEARHAEEFELRAAGGALVPVEFSCRPIQYLGRPATAVALRDLSDRRRDEARIRHLALHDALTDLPNRYLLTERLDHALDTATQGGTGVAVIYLDLDRFKPVNDRYGHAVGDALLVQVAKRMLAELRPADTLARVGGDEFVAVLANAPPEQAAETAARLLAGLRHPFLIEGHNVEIGGSAGLALYPGDGATAETLLRAADTALYRVKEEGRGAVRFFEASMDLQVQARQQLEHELAGALDRGELQMFYQPLVNARTGGIETFEALIRWQHPIRGMVPPGAFIPIAEQSGLIAGLGAWVIATVCRAAAAWPSPWQVSVNVSPSQFRLSDVPNLVAAALTDSGLAPNRLVVEITESVFIQDADQAVGVLSQLRGLGVRLALDDFGTGYSSLSYLQRFKFDTIKIDRSFVARLGQHADTLTIVRATVNLAHNLGMQVVVEGVETAEQLAILRQLGCEQMQGYLFGRPAAEPCTSPLAQARLRALFVQAPTRLSA